MITCLKLNIYMKASPDIIITKIIIDKYIKNSMIYFLSHIPCNSYN